MHEQKAAAYIVQVGTVDGCGIDGQLKYTVKLVGPAMQFEAQ